MQCAYFRVLCVGARGWPVGRARPVWSAGWAGYVCWGVLRVGRPGGGACADIKPARGSAPALRSGRARTLSPVCEQCVAGPLGLILAHGAGLSGCKIAFPTSSKQMQPGHRRTQHCSSTNR
eukprot:scaffold1632_cov63-Phaeocystis_antarctica.AAC.6